MHLKRNQNQGYKIEVTD